MCRNIRVLFNFEPPATEDEIRAAALQYVRKVSGMTRPSQSNAALFEQAVDEITAITAHLVGELTTSATPRDRDEEAEKGRQRWQKRRQRMQEEAG